MCSEISFVPTAAEIGWLEPGGNSLNPSAGIAFVKVICRQSPTLARSTIGRGRLPGRNWMLLPVPVVSALSAKTQAFGMDAPRRFSITAFGIATTLALTVRVHCCMAAAAATGGEAVSAVSDFTDSVSALGDSVAGFTAVSSFAGTTGFAASFRAGAVDSATGLSTAASGVCAPAITAVSKLKMITVNEVTMRTGDLEPNIFNTPSLTFAVGETLKD